MRRVVSRAFRILVLVGFEIGSVATLVRLGDRDDLAIPWHDLGLWLDTTSPEIAIGAAVRLLALAAACGLLGTTLGYLLARLFRVPQLVAAFGAATLPVVRRNIDRALAVTVTTAVLIAPMARASAQEAPPQEPAPTTNAGVGVQPPGTNSAGYTPTPAGLPTGREPVVTKDTEPPPIPGPATARSYVVRSGDNFWRIALADLSADGTAPDRGDITPHWLRIIRLNEDRIRSGDPDLIYPGETITLPPTETSS